MLKETINQEFIKAFKAKNNFRKDTLGILKSKITEAEKKNNTELSNQDIYGVISSLIKQREQAIDVYNQNTSEQAKLNAQKEVDEIVILKTFLPSQMSDDEMSKIVSDFITQESLDKNNKSVLGIIMKEFNSKYKGRFDNKKLKEITEQILSV